MCVWKPEHIYVHVYTEQQVTQDVFLSYAPPYFFETKSPIKHKAHQSGWNSWLARKPQVSSCIYLPNAEITD